MIALWILAGFAWTVGAATVCVGVYRRWEGITRAPALDVAVSLLTWVPMVVSAVAGGWAGFALCFLGQFLGLQLWCILHTAASGHKGPKIRHALDRIVGSRANHLGLWITIPALPLFLVLRALELFVYPGLIWVLNFPRIRQDEWVTVSRQKFDGLVGHDLIWCLYCDWMTGVYSLGAEMLRNVESFWCPIRFYDGKKCENCRIDFPDLDVWVPADGTMKQVTDLLEE
jgi:hypothetical protein